MLWLLSHTTFKNAKIIQIFFLWCSSIYKSCLGEIFPFLIFRILRIFILKMHFLILWLTHLAYYGVPLWLKAKIRDFYFSRISETGFSAHLYNGSATLGFYGNTFKRFSCLYLTFKYLKLAYCFLLITVTNC